MAKSQWLLIGGDTLLGKEIRDLVEDRKLPVTLRVAAGESPDPVLTAENDELAVMEPLSAALVEDVQVILLGGTPQANRQALAYARDLKPRPASVDLLGEFEELPESVLRSPLLETPARKFPAASMHVPAHPAAAALARLLTTLHASRKIRSSVVTALEPVSEQGKSGIDELHKQSISLFNFQSMPKQIFDTQVSFNMLPRYGAESSVDLSKSERRAERHLATLLGSRGLPLPSIRLVHAPVFHGYCLNAWIEFESRPSVQEASGLLVAAGFDVRDAETEPASNLAVAGQSGITVSDIVEDRSNPRALWLWAAFDNVRTLADEALLIAGLLSRRGGGA